jgi:hypothetical protein
MDPSGAAVPSDCATYDSAGNYFVGAPSEHVEYVRHDSTVYFRPISSALVAWLNSHVPDWGTTWENNITIAADGSA